MHTNLLATEKLSTLMKSYAIPCTISLPVGALYNIVDQIFIANAGSTSVLTVMPQIPWFFP